MMKVSKHLAGIGSKVGKEVVGEVEVAKVAIVRNNHFCCILRGTQTRGIGTHYLSGFFMFDAHKIYKMLSHL